MTEQHQKCAYCNTRDESVATHSGIMECRKCWNYRKLDGPAAAHWAKVTKDFFSSVDMHDLMTYLPEVIGLDRHRRNIMFDAVFLLKIKSEYLKEHGPEHRWSDSTMDEYKADVSNVIESLNSYTITKEGESTNG
jgi:hypothetical protein